jgi:hypothetical protein
MFLDCKRRDKILYVLDSKRRDKILYVFILQEER